MKIQEWINSNIEKEGARNFFDNVNNAWNEIESEVKDMILNEIYAKIKPSKIETIHDLSKLLDGNNYGNELDNEFNIDVEDICHKNKWIICFPYSDDCFEVRGFIDDELGAWEGNYYKIYKKGDFYPDSNEDNTYHKADQNMITEISDEPDCDINAEWCNDKYDEETKKKYIWNYIVNENLPHVYFEIMDEDTVEDEVWAKCCIIDLSNIL